MCLSYTYISISNLDDKFEDKPQLINHYGSDINYTQD